MRKKTQEITNWKTLEEILSSALICRLAMMDGNRTYLLPFNYGYRDRTIYIHSAPEGRKIEILRRNPHVSFEVEDSVQVISGNRACDWSTRYRSLVGEGKVEIITDDDGKRKGLGVIMAQHGAPDLDLFSGQSLRRMVILKLSISAVSGKKSSNWDHSPE